MRYQTNADFQAKIEAFDLSVDVIMGDIVREHRAAQKRAKGKKVTAGPASDLAIMDLDLTSEVGRMTPPVRIYLPDPATGELRLTEELKATAFRERVLASALGKKFQARIQDLRDKRRKAGIRSKTRARAARARLRSAGITSTFSPEAEGGA